jgi:transcription elongation factor Elf1
MGIAMVVCPYCGHETEAPTTESGRVGGVRRRLKQEYRAARHTCTECGHDYDIRGP